MDKETLYELLDIDNPAQFQYFENIAALLECNLEIQEDVLFALIAEVDKALLADLINQYFEEIAQFIPDDGTDISTLFENIRLSLMGMAGSCHEENILVKLVDELERFRKWYSMESKVECTSFDGKGDCIVPLQEALVMIRVENMTKESYFYDFSACTDYPLEEYVMSFGDLIMAGEEAENFGRES